MEGHVLCERYLELTTDKESFGDNQVFKYSRVEVIVEALLRKLQSDVDRRKTVFTSVAIFSPLGHSGKTRLARAVAMSDEVRGGLYIGMESYGSYEINPGNVTMSEIGYLIKMRSDELFGYLDKVEDDMIYSSWSFSDNRLLELTDMEWFLDSLKKYGKYTTTAFDLDSASIKDVSVLQAFDYVIMPITTDEQDKMKVKVFYELLRGKEFSKLADRILEVNVPASEYGSSEMIKCVDDVMKAAESGKRRKIL